MAATRQKNDYLGRGATSRVYKLNKTQNAQASQEKTKSSKRKDKTISIHSNKFSKLNEHQSRSCSWKPVGIESLNQKHKHPHPDWCVVLSERTNKDSKAIGLAILAYYPSPSYACVVLECFVRVNGIKEFVWRESPRNPTLPVLIICPSSGLTLPLCSIITAPTNQSNQTTLSL